MLTLFSRLMGWFLHLWVRTTVLPAKMETLAVNKEVLTVYVLQDKSYADFLVLEKEIQQQGFQSARHKIKLGSSNKKISAVFATKNKSYQPTKKSLIDKQKDNLSQKLSEKNKARLDKLSQASLLKREKHNKDNGYLPRNLRAIVAHLNENPKQTIQLLPVHVRWGRSPEKENSWWKAFFLDTWIDPGMFRKLILILVHGKQTFVSFSPPVQLTAEMIDGLSVERGTQKIMRLFRMNFIRQEEAMVGPDLSHRRTMFAEVLKRTKVMASIEQESEKKGLSKESSALKAYEYINEIASDYNYATVRFMDILLTRVWSQIYNGVDVKGNEHIRALAGTHEIVYVPCHRSHIDYLLLSYVLYKNGFATPYIAAGVNLNIPIIGGILRRGGAFFLRRSFKGNPLYATVFNEYLAMLIKRGYAIGYFVEGGRSRTGRLLPPRMGMLAMTVKASSEPNQKPVAFVPVYVGYEKIMEMGSYIGELYGKQKKKESVGGFVSALKRLKQDFGRVHVRFAQPILLDEVMREELGDWQQVLQQHYTAETQQESGDELLDTMAFQQRKTTINGAIEKLGNRVVSGINLAADVNVTNLLALVMMGVPSHVIDKQQLIKQLGQYQDFIARLKEGCYKDISVSDLSPEEIIEWGIKLDMLDEESHVLGGLIRLNQAQSLSMTYFRNNSLHIIVMSSLLASIFVNNKELTRKQAKSLVQWVYPFVKSELFLPWNESELDAVIDKHLTIMLEYGIIEKHNTKISKAYRQEDGQFLQMLAHLVSETIERYYIVITILEHQGSGVMTSDELEGITRMMAQRLAILYSINAPDYYDKTVIRGFVRTLKDMQLLYVNDEAKIAYDFPIDEAKKNAARLIDGRLLNQIQHIAKAENNKIITHLRKEQAEKNKKKRSKKAD